MQRPILVYPDPFLSTKAAVVGRVGEEIRTLVRDMFETMYAAGGVGLAAPQVGVGKRVVVLDVSPVDKACAPLALVNPEIVERKGVSVGVEGCLSVPGVEGEVPRADFVAIRGQNDQGEPVHLTARGFLARALQHEIDHLDGILFIEKISSTAASGR